MATSAPQGNPVGRWFGDRGVNTEILAAVATASAVALGVGGVGIVQLGPVDQRANEIAARQPRQPGVADSQRASELARLATELQQTVGQFRV